MGQVDDPTVWPPDCFEESASYGRGDILDPLETLVSDASQLNNISKTVFGNQSRVAFLRYCTDSSTKYIESVQVGITNGIGSQSQWLNVLGHDDKISELNDCSIYQLEKDDVRVSTLEIGYLGNGSNFDKGVIWLRFLLRDLKNSGPSDSDVTVTIGKIETYMLKKTLKFSQKNAFIGFHGKMSSGT